MSSFFYLHMDKTERNGDFIQGLNQYAVDNQQQVYVLDRPLIDNKYSYDFDEGVVLLAPNHKILFINFGDDVESFDEFVDDFVEDMGSISDKFRYKKIVGRPRSWWDGLMEKIEAPVASDDISALLKEHSLSTGLDKKKVELLISLLTGSINDIEKVRGDVPDNILDKVKQKILLFDGDQTRFIYQNPKEEIIRIQGLSGTGKTELLLHKLKDIYLESPDNKVMFTCHNKVLADSLNKRIPAFFDFMKVEAQIKWNERLWCVNAWGSKFKPNSGAYAYICAFYNLSFLRYSRSNNFKEVCRRAVAELTPEAIKEHGFAFDYMLIDESQDFTEEFFQLCKLVTKKSVFVAGDIFQGIFDSTIISEIQPDYLLSKCYRTDPKTLMFAHALGMGLFENPKLRWLEKDEWRACGYLLNEEPPGQYTLKREPLRRFEDLEDEGFSSIDIIKTSKARGELAETKILELIAKIRDENPTVLAEDIGVIFLDGGKSAYETADRLEISIPREFNWEVNKAYESKQKLPDTLFVSNTNNVKGLEFAFVICVTKTISRARNYRNALYMMLTRSFIKSFLLISEDTNVELSAILERGLTTIKNEDCLVVSVPSAEEKEEIKTTINYASAKSDLYDTAYSIFDELEVEPIFRANLYKALQAIVNDDFEPADVYEIISMNYDQIRRRKK